MLDCIHPTVFCATCWHRTDLEHPCLVCGRLLCSVHWQDGDGRCPAHRIAGWRRRLLRWLAPAVLLVLISLPTPAAAAAITFSLCTGSTFTMTVDGVPRTAFDSLCSFVDGNMVTHPSLQAQVHTAPGEAFAPLTLNGLRQLSNGGVLWSGGAETFYFWILYDGGGDSTSLPRWTTWAPVFVLADGDPIAVEVTHTPALAHTPEPLSLMLMGVTLLTVGYIARRRRDANHL